MILMRVDVFTKNMRRHLKRMYCGLRQAQHLLLRLHCIARAIPGPSAAGSPGARDLTIRPTVVRKVAGGEPQGWHGRWHGEHALRIIESRIENRVVRSIGRSIESSTESTRNINVIPGIIANFTVS